MAFQRQPGMSVPPASSVDRRRFLQTLSGGAIVLSGLLGATRASAAPVRLQSGGEKQKLSISVGRQPWAAGNSPITQYMMNNDLFEKAASQQGYDLKVDYRDYPSAQPQVEAMIGNELDLGMWGNTPIIRAIAAKQPVSIIDVGEGHFRFILATRPDRGIRKVEDLKGKTVGALLGGDPYNVLSQMLLYMLGSGNPKDNGITVVNTPTQAQAATIPRGMDAAVVIYPAFLKAQKETGTVGIINSFGYTEDYYKGPAGEGGGILLEQVKKSPFYPDGFYLHRSLWMARNAVLKDHPKVITAFAVAQQQALKELSAMKPQDVASLVQKYWELSPDDGAKIVNDGLLFKRKWVWLTEGDARSVLETSKFMVSGGLIDNPLTWQQVKDNVSTSAPPVKQAYELSGSFPPAEQFQETDTEDIRGLPSWELDQWKDTPSNS